MSIKKCVGSPCVVSRLYERFLLEVVSPVRTIFFGENVSVWVSFPIFSVACITACVGFRIKAFTSSFLDVVYVLTLWVVAPWRTIAAGGTPHWAEGCTPHEAKGCSPHESKGSLAHVFFHHLSSQYLNGNSVMYLCSCTGPF